MDPNAFLAGLQQNGTQFTPAQLQQIQLFQQQQQNQQQQLAPQNVDTLSTNNDQSGHSNNNNNNNNSTSHNPNNDMNGAANFQGTTQSSGTNQVANAPPGNPAANSFTANNAFQMALLTSPLQQQLAALSGYSQQQQSNSGQVSNDNNTMQKQQQQGTDNGQAQQQQQIQTWNPQMVQQQFNGVNPFMAAQGLVLPTPMNVQQLQQQFLTQQFLTQQLAAAGHNPATAGNFNHILASLLAQSGATSAMNPTAAGIPNQMFQAPVMSGFPFVAAPVAPQQHLVMTNMNNQNHTNVKGSSNDGMKGSGEVEWTKPFATKVKKESPFPLKLYQILGNPECQECITWNPHGRSWRILKPPVFEQVVIPLYFRHAKYASFMRQVNGWGFKRVVTGSDHNSYYHELFVRDNPQLCLQMKRIKRTDTDETKPNKDDDGHDDDDLNHDEKAVGSGESNAGNMTSTQPAISTLPTPTQEDLLKFAGMTGMLPVGINNGAMVGQPNFMLNNVLPAAALIGNPNAAIMNSINPMNFVTGLAGATNAAPQTLPQQPNQLQFQPTPQQQSQSSTPTVAMSNVTTGASQQNATMLNSSAISNTFTGVDSATLAKIQEIVASGGAETLLQQLQQQQVNSGFGGINNNNTSTAAGSGSTTLNTVSNNNDGDTPNQGAVTVKEENEGTLDNDDDEDDDYDDEDDDDDDEDDV